MSKIYHYPAKPYRIVTKFYNRLRSQEDSSKHRTAGMATTTAATTTTTTNTATTTTTTTTDTICSSFDDYYYYNGNSNSNNNNIPPYGLHEDGNSAMHNTPALSLSSSSSSSSPRHIGILSAVCMLISLIVGSGIFSTPATVLRLCGTPAMSLILWLLGAVITYGGALAFIEMGLMYPKNGGAMRYLGYSYPHPRALVSFVFSYVVCLFIRPATIAAGATAFSETFLYAVGGGVDMPQKNPFLFAHHDWIGRAIGAAATTLVVLLNIVSVRWSLRVVNVLAVMKSLTLLIICIVGIVVLAGGIPVAPNDNWARGFRGTSTQAYNYVSAMNKIFWAYEGWGNLSYAGGELKNPRRNLPLSMGIGLGLITVLYVLANVAFFSVVPIDQTDDSGTIIGAVFTTKVFGTIAGEIILPIIMALSSLGVNIGEIYSGARLLHSAADVGFVPFGHYVAQIHPTFKTPMYSLLIIWVLSLVFLFVPPPGKTFDLLVDLVSYPMWYFYALAITGCIILRRKFPAHPRRTFRAPISVCVLFVLACLFLAFAVFIPPRGRQGSVRSNSYLIGPLVALGFMVLMVVPWALRMFWYAKRYGREYDAWIAKEENAIATEGLGIAVESRLSFRDIEDTYGSTPWRIVQNYPYIQ